MLLLLSTSVGDSMTNNQELLRHAERCRDLAESCCDKAVAAKLRDLANSYEELADVLPGSFAHSSPGFGDGAAAGGRFTTVTGPPPMRR